MQNNWDVIVIGGGGAGMFCAAQAAQRGRSVLLLDHAKKLGQKILISGGGRCNFTNINASPLNYYSNNSHFAKSAMSKFQPQDFIRLVEKYGLKYYEKKLGQLFCVESAQKIVDILLAECKLASVTIALETSVNLVSHTDNTFHLQTNTGNFTAQSLVIATGGLSFPKVGATDFGYKIAKQFGHDVTPLDPALVMLNMDDAFRAVFSEYSGTSLDTVVSVNGKSFRENILFTHNGISGPAILQASLYWRTNDSISIDLCPGKKMEEWFMQAKKDGAKKEWRNLLAEFTGGALADALAKYWGVSSIPLIQMPDQQIRELGRRLNKWVLVPTSTGGFGRAEVTRGGVNTDALSSKNLESKLVPGLYFIGEVVDVTGMLGGYNLQWAWASAYAAAQTV